MKRSDVKPDDGALSVTSTELLRRARANNQQAWDELVDKYSRRMYRWCRRAGLQPADASNTVQEALAAVARKLGDFHRDRPGDTFRGWLRRITDNKIRDHYRREGRRDDIAAGGTDGQHRLAQLPGSASSEPATWDTSIVTTSPQDESLRPAIERVRENISDRDWRFFWRVVVDGQTAADVAREFGVTSNTVRLVKMRVLRKLRQATEHVLNPTGGNRANGE